MNLPRLALSISWPCNGLFKACVGLSLTVSACMSAPEARLHRWELEPETVIIRRDNWGVPHIYAADEYGVYYGYGQALAEDRLYQLEILKRSTQGTVSEWLGPDYIDFDRTQRALFWPQDIKAQMAALPESRREAFVGMADGINARILEVMSEPDKFLPQEFTAIHAAPSRWSEYDVVMLFVGSMLLRYGDFNTELENLALLATLTEQHGAKAARKIFDAINPLGSEQALVTIPETDWQWQAIPHERRVNNAEGIRPTTSRHASMVSRAQQGFSNAFVLGPEHLKTARAVLVNGPQFGWYVPAYTYSAGFHTPEWEAVGNAPLGYPLPMFGHNQHIAWGSTWSAGDNVDLFAEKIKPDDQEQYLYQGEWHRFESRQENIRVRGAQDVTFTARRSVHGPIIRHDPEQARAYAKQRGWAGRELTTLLAWMDATRARNHSQWKQALNNSAINVNWYYADKQGNIGYFAGGAYPERANGHDNRLPASSEDNKDWLGLYPPEHNPQIRNPSSGYIANWNNSPGKGAIQPDPWWYKWGEADRIHILTEAIEGNSPLTPDKAWKLMMQASYIDPNAKYFRPAMLAAIEGTTSPRHRQMALLLKKWDGTFEKSSGKGSAISDGAYYEEPAIALFRFWLAEMQRLVLSDDLPGPTGQALATNTGYGTPDQPSATGLNIPVGLKLLHEALQGRTEYDFLNGRDANGLWLEACDLALARLEKDFGSTPQDWTLPVPPTRFGHRNFLGIPQTSEHNARFDIADMNRGTENNMIVFAEDGSVRGFEVVPPGQSGHTGPDGHRSAHYEDQFELYKQHGRKPVLFAYPDVLAVQKSVLVLRLPGR